jgi:hypothetical protein
VVGPPFKKAALMVKLMPVQEDSTVMPKATAGLRFRNLCASKMSLFSDY